MPLPDRALAEHIVGPRSYLLQNLPRTSKHTKQILRFLLHVDFLNKNQTETQQDFQPAFDEIFVSNRKTWQRMVWRLWIWPWILTRRSFWQKILFTSKILLRLLMRRYFYYNWRCYSALLHAWNACQLVNLFFFVEAVCNVLPRIDQLHQLIVISMLCYWRKLILEMYLIDDWKKTTFI